MLTSKKAALTLVLSLSALLSLVACLPQTRQAITADQSHRCSEPVLGVSALSREITAIISDQAFAASNFGIAVIDLQKRQVLYSHNGHKLFHPASTMKLYTTAAALAYLGPTHRFSTSVAVQPGARTNSVVHGDLWLMGHGDPTLMDSDLMALAQMVSDLGIREITGNMIVDDSAFDDLRYGKGWMWDDQPYKDFAPIGALSVNRNTVTIFVSSASEPGAPPTVRLEPATDFVRLNNLATTSQRPTVTDNTNRLTVLRHWQAQENIIDITGAIPLSSLEQPFTVNIAHPATYTATLFKEALGRLGIKVQGAIFSDKTPPDAQIIAEHHSLPLSEIIVAMNKDSRNLDAELLLKAVGSRVTGETGTADNGIKAITTWLATTGVSHDASRFADGSGVSRYNLVSPTDLISLLTEVYGDETIRQEFMASLPIAGVDGTLRDRMQDTAAATIVQAKTGSMIGVSSLAGYGRSLDNTPLAFVVMMEHFLGNKLPAHVVQDLICDILCRYREE